MHTFPVTYYSNLFTTLSVIDIVTLLMSGRYIGIKCDAAANLIATKPQKYQRSNAMCNMNILHHYYCTLNCILGHPQ